MNAKIFTVIVALIGIGFIGGYALHGLLTTETAKAPLASEATSQQIRQNSQYMYINPLLECDVANGVIDARKENFQDELEVKVNQLREELALTNVAVYFRDLNNGPTSGVNTSDEFLPASLLKVPVMMGYYHWAEQSPGLLQVNVQFNESQDFGYVPTIVPKNALVIGQMYTIDELIRRMIVYSDNQALYLLSSQLPKEYLKDLFTMLGVRDEILINSDAKLTVKEYASFFRILYNSSYLSRQYSEKALSLLAQTEFHEGITSGVHDGIRVAHKFGEAGTGNVERQLHDCGIVYFPGHPYLACIMTRGRDAEQLKDSIASISRFIYDKIDEQY